MADRKRLGELLIQQEIVSQDTINDALRIQVGSNRRLGHILLKMNAVSEDQLVETLSKQLDTGLININDAFSEEVKNILPRYLCKKYGALPLSLHKNNILMTAMSDPSDNVAITDIEHYTGKVVDPCLARQSDIQASITKKIPYSLQDTFNSHTSKGITKFIAATTFILVVLLGSFTLNYIQTSRYGTVSNHSESTIYEHFNLMVGFDNSGKISLLGHSAFTDGYYSVSFNKIEALSAFIANRQDDFSKKQYKWLHWVLNKEASHP